MSAEIINNKKNSPHVVAVKNQWELNKKARRRIRVAGGKVEVYEARPSMQSLEETVTKAAATEKHLREEANAQAVAGADIGQPIDGRGIFLGTFTLKAPETGGLSQTFNIFAAPEDLPLVERYARVTKEVAGLKDWHGHNGTPYETDQELYKALRDGTYDGGWFIPPRELLNGYKVSGTEMQPDNLYAHMNKGALKNTFNDTFNLAAWYWSSTPHRDRHSEFYNVHFRSNQGDWSGKNSQRLSCRPLRLEPVSS